MATASRSQAQWSPRSSMGAAPLGGGGQKHAAFLKHFPGRRRDDAAGLGLGAAHEAGPLLRRGPGPGHGAFHISGVHAAAGEHHSVRREGHGGGAAQHEDVHRGRVHGLLDGRSPRQRALETAVVRLALAHQHDRGGAARGHGLARRPGEIRPSPLHHAGLVVHGVLHIGAGGKRLADALDAPSLRRARHIRRHLGRTTRLARALAHFSAPANSSAMSLTGTSESADTIPSASMVRQNGHEVAKRSGSVSSAWAQRASLMRAPALSSSHMRPPPAPQQKLARRLRSISTTLPPAARTTARGAS